MSNDIYNLTRYQLLTGAFNWLTVDARLVAMSGTPDFVETDLTLNDVVLRGASMIGYSDDITSQTVTVDGTAQTNTVFIPNSVVGPPVTWFLMVKHATPSLNAQLLIYIDEAAVFPFDHRGLDIVVQPDWLLNRGWWRP